MAFKSVDEAVEESYDLLIKHNLNAFRGYHDKGTPRHSRQQLHVLIITIAKALPATARKLLSQRWSLSHGIGETHRRLA